MIRVLALALLSALPASAQQYDPALIPACLGAAPDQTARRACIGLASQACMNAAGGETTAGMHGCLSPEIAQWDEMLNAAYAGLRQSSDSRATALRDAQRAWIAFVDAACAYEASAYEGGSLAGVVGGTCRMQRTAERALELRGYVEEEGR
ncbi:lysozyme inhibitor LprI family protein [Paracoccus sp. (in: a-proteobacteria)]|uniref:lysozyme inhibitor LprI family protein n=1 Tax=Paracoccus sp. TaxID=267 RepID=UPI0026E104EA|nr:lysozyme inhibitor LprI family protein [Paracoccus sp. (in: a-proteobacteria)]MDO5370691.1 lysozyme inhibitor LprI family protein [Paracoccus sp. (in: a-proteobacteria)]